MPLRSLYIKSYILSHLFCVSHYYYVRMFHLLGIFPFPVITGKELKSSKLQIQWCFMVRTLSDNIVEFNGFAFCWSVSIFTTADV